jgi:hypothetical protein
MSANKTYDGVTQAVWNCVQTTSTQQHGTVYTFTSSDDSQGTSMTKGENVGIHWHVKMQFNFSAANSQLAYTILDKSWEVTEDEIWDGLSSTINGCQNQ